MAARRGTIVVALGLLLATAACGGGGGATGSTRTPARVRATAAATDPSPGATTPVETSPVGTAPVTADPALPVDSSPAAATPVPPAAPSPVDGLFGVGGARQVVSVIADADGASTATLTAYERQDGAWVRVFGPWPADVGAHGFAPRGQKREGDLRTPSGAFGFDFAFGVLADPGVELPFRRVTSPAIVWDDDPSSPRYNLWTDTTTQEAGADPEPMYNQPAYDYGVVIAYNPERTPGLGSAIFLHVTGGGPTAGCVAVTADRLVALLRWLDPARDPRIVMGTRDEVAA